MYLRCLLTQATEVHGHCVIYVIVFFHYLKMKLNETINPNLLLL